MSRDEWIELFKKIPDSMHDQVILTLSTGIDVYIQRFLQWGDHNLLIRGRLGGTDEGERIFLVPWQELRLLLFSRPIGDEILFSVFGELIGGIRKSMMAKTTQEEEEEEDMEEEEDELNDLRALSAAPVPSPKAGVDLDDVRMRLLQPRKPPPRTETNKPGPGKPSPGGKPIK
jgi:hypothetical protein